LIDVVVLASLKNRLTMSRYCKLGMQDLHGGEPAEHVWLARYPGPHSTALIASRMQ